METITATELARSPRAVLDSVLMRREAVVIERNQVAIARLVPAEHTMTAAQALADFRPTLTPQQASAWLQDQRGSFDAGPMPTEDFLVERASQQQADRESL